MRLHPFTRASTFRSGLLALLMILGLSALSCSGDEVGRGENTDLDVGLDGDGGLDTGILSVREPRVIEGATVVDRPGDTVLPCPQGGCPVCEVDADCEDGVACTEAVCDTEAGECVVSTRHARCDDGLFCNGYELCAPDDPEANARGCIAGEPPVLSDGLSCTLDFCDEELDQLVHQPEDRRCDDENPCTATFCDPMEGCVSEPLADGTLCVRDTRVCQGGACVACIDDSEGGVDTGCGGNEAHCVAGACAQCEEDSHCPSGLSCDQGVCTGCTDNAQCDDGVACTLDICDQASGACVYSPQISICDTGDLCAEGDPICAPGAPSADATGCVAPPSVLDHFDAFSCVTRSCDPSTGVITEELDDSECESSNPCIAAECTRQGCVETPLPVGSACGDAGEVCDGQGSCATCVDNRRGRVDQGCSEDAPDCIQGTCGVCEEEGPGCELDCAGVPGGASYVDACGVCDDDPMLDCITVCEGGQCDPCDTDAQCDDGNSCTVDRCVNGYCQRDSEALEGEVCDGLSLNRCVENFVCRNGTCQSGPTSACDGPCQLGGTCDPFQGCAIDVGAPCDDGDPLTENDTCNSRGQCVGLCTDGDGAGCPELDGNPCTVPACDEEGGCTERITPGANCEMACGAGVCSTEGVCEPVANVCNRASMLRCATFECRPDEGGCVLAEGDANCALEGASCNSELRLCDAGFCGDGFCDMDQEYSFSGPEICPEDCVRQGCVASSSSAACSETLQERRVLGTWRSGQSIAYGFPEADARQTETIRTQLEEGVEWLHLVVDYCSPGATSGPACICRANDTCAQASSPLRDRLLEIRDFMVNNPNRIVQIYVQSHLGYGDLRQAVAQANLEDFLYVPTSYTPGGRETFPATRAQLAAANRRLLIYDRDFLPRANVFLGDHPYDPDFVIFETPNAFAGLYGQPGTVNP